MLPLLLFLPFAGALLYLLLPMGSKSPLPKLLALLVNGAALAVLTLLTLEWSPEAPLIFARPWLPDLGLEFTLWLDGPALFWAWLVLGIGFLVLFYAVFYMDPADAPRRFYGTMLLFMGSMLGVVIARNIVLMLIFWEMTSVSSFLLIGHWHQKEEARQGATRALIVTGAGGLCLLAGIAGLVWIAKDLGLSSDALNWDGFWAARNAILSHGAAPAIAVLMLLGAFTKSAQFPFHFWLPGAMEAPTPVSAYLHAATMVKAGIYLIGRIYPVFSDLAFWLWLLAPVGLATMLIGGFMAIVAKDLKQLLAFSTVSQLGLIVSYYGFGAHLVGTDHLLTLDLLLVLSHALFKGGLFMLVGVIDHGAHTRDWTRLGGLWKSMPATAILTTIGCLSMAGFPLTLGFIAKKLWETAASHAGLPYDSPAISPFYWAVVAASAFTVAYCLRLTVSTFLGKPRDASIHAREGSFGILLAPGILMVLVLAGGLVNGAVEPVFSRTVQGTYYALESHYSYALYKTFDLKTGISLLTLFVLGPALYLVSGSILRAYDRAGQPRLWAEAFYGWPVDRGVPVVSAWITDRLQRPSLSRNVALLLVMFVLMVMAPLLRFGLGESLAGPLPDAAPPLIAFVAAGMIAMGGYLVVKGVAIILRLLGASIIGLNVGLLFVLYKAPDLALTQVLVELASLVMLLLLLIRRLPDRMDRRLTQPARLLPTSVAACCGLLVGGLAYAAALSPLRDVPVLPDGVPTKDFYLLNSKDPDPITGADHGGEGANVVNVILVDFRGFDTMGEISVLALAGIGVLVLMGFGRRRVARARDIVEHQEPPPLSVKPLPQQAPPGTDPVPGFHLGDEPPIVLHATVRPIMVFMSVFAVLLFFAGHNSPGGGFIAGLLTAAAFLPYFLTVPRSEDEKRLRLKDPVVLLPVGLLFAVGTGLVPLLLGYGFLRSAYTSFDVPLVGYVGLSTAALFDLGVYLTVVGVVVVILKSFGREPN